MSINWLFTHARPQGTAGKVRCFAVWQNWSVVGKCPATEGEQMFYNGANLVLDLALVAVTYIIGHGIGYRKGINK
jgi:hypothetical protein